MTNELELEASPHTNRYRPAIIVHALEELFERDGITVVLEAAEFVLENICRFKEDCHTFDCVITNVRIELASGFFSDLALAHRPNQLKHIARMRQFRQADRPTL